MKNTKYGMLLIMIFFMVNTFTSYGASKPELDKNGNITFVTTDTIATTNIRWSEVGFTIRRDESDGNPIKDKNYAVLFMKESYRTKKDIGNGKYKVTFTIPKEDINEALTKAGISGIGEKDVIYLNGIFKVIRNGVEDKSYYRTLDGIIAAASWRNPKDFKELFDVRVPFKTPKYPVYIEYRTNENEVMYTKTEDMLEEKEKISLTLDTSLRYGGKDYNLYRSFLIELKNPSRKLEDYKISLGNTMAEIKNRDIKVKIGGVKLVAMMKPDKVPLLLDENNDYLGEELPEEVEAFCIINGDERGNEAYEVTEGIPTMENLYVNGFCEDYIREYNFQCIRGEKTYPVTVKRTYHLNWTESHTVTDKKTGKPKTTYTSQSQSQTVTRTIYVKREYSYWRIERLVGMIPKSILVQNGALPGGLLTIEAKEPKIPNVIYQQWGKVDNHIKDPVYSETITLSSVSVSGGSSRPGVPTEEFTSYAEARVPEIEVRNDLLNWNNTVIMDGGYKKEKGNMPSMIPSSNRLVDNQVFYKNRLSIDPGKENAEYISSGKVTYEAFLNIGGGEKSESYIMEDINPVTVHTPVVCNGKIEDKYKDCQMLFPDTRRCSLVLGLNFNVLLETVGQHKRITGYGYNDYKKYMSLRQVKFPFDVIKNGVRKKAGEWLDTGVEETYSLPTDVLEGKYEVMFRTIAINGKDKLEKEQGYANEGLENYVAVNTVLVEVSGRLYDFQIFDISDYPLWKNVFRKPNSMEKTGFHYSVGDLPVKNGKHPIYPGEGNLKPGYVLRMSLITIGNMEEEDCYVRILPKFYHINQAYEDPVEVDLYYEETIGGIYYPLVAIGSKVDDENVKQIKLSDTSLGIEKELLSYTARKKEIPLETLLDTWFKTYNYRQIMLPSAAQMLVLPEGMQKWYFEYSLPSKIYAAPKGYDVKGYCENNLLDFKEDFWIKEGYLVINFDIETIKGGQRHLSYTNQIMEGIGYCNMWKKEGFLFQHGFKEGDVGVFDLIKSAASDYQSRGTH